MSHLVISGANLEVPHFKLEPHMCSRYARLAAKELFGKEYATCHAWNRKHHDILRGRVGERSLDDLARSGILEPGMILGVFIPESKYNGVLDEKGNPAEYTHNMLYVGLSSEGEAVFFEQFGEDIRARTSSQFREHNLRGIEFFDSKA